MSIELEKIKRLNDLTTAAFRRKHIIVLNPDEKIEKAEDNPNIIYDEIGWKIPEKISPILNELKNNSKFMKNFVRNTYMMTIYCHTYKK